MTYLPQMTISGQTAAPVSAMPLSTMGEAPSPLVLCDRLLTLAQDADRAGCAITAEHLIHLAHSVFDEPRAH